ERSHGPQQAVAAQVVDGGLANAELGELLDPVLDHRAPVVEAPGRERMDARDVGQHVSAPGDLVGLESEFARVGPERTAPLEQEEARSVELGAGGPERLARGGVPGRAAEAAETRPHPPPVGHLEHVADAGRLKRLDHLFGEVALVQPERGLLAPVPRSRATRVWTLSTAPPTVPALP